MIFRIIPILIYSELLALNGKNTFEENWDEKELILLVNKALDDLYNNDSYLIEKNVHERSLVFRFGLYFNKNLEKSQKFSKLDLDIEYNRDLVSSTNKDPKRTKEHHNGICPDLILHTRGTRNNILVLEFKTHWSDENSADLDKLKELTSPNQQYHYQLGISIVFGKKRDDCDFVYVRDGEISKSHLVLKKGEL